MRNFRTVEIRSPGLLDDALAPAWGCQYVLRFRDVECCGDHVRATVRVEDISPPIFAPRVTLPWSIAAAAINGERWHYFDDRILFLPNQRGEYRVEVKRGLPTDPHIVATFARVAGTNWQDDVLTVATELPPWVDAVAPGYQFRMAIRSPRRKLLRVDGGEIVRQGSGDPDRPEVRVSKGATEHWAVVRFDVGRISLQYG